MFGEKENLKSENESIDSLFYIFKGFKQNSFLKSKSLLDLFLFLAINYTSILYKKEISEKDFDLVCKTLENIYIDMKKEDFEVVR